MLPRLPLTPTIIGVVSFSWPSISEHPSVGKMPLQDQVSLRSSFSGEENVQREELSSSNEEDTYSLLAAEQFQNAARRLYISHSLSTWNSRMFEFGAFLFLAGLFPGTLLFASIYALSRSLAVSLLSSWIGGVMDKSNRLSTIRSSISEQHPATFMHRRLTSMQSGKGSLLLLHALSFLAFPLSPI